MNRTRTARRALAGVLLPAVLLPVAACSGGEPDAAAPAASTQAATEAAADAAAEVSEPTATPGAEVPVEELLAMLEEGFAGVTTSSLGLELSGGPLALSAEGEVDYTADPADVALRLDSRLLGGEGAELRVVDEVVYLRVPGFLGDGFVRFGPDELGAVPGGAFLGRLDPRGQLEALRGGVQRVEYVGSEEVAGEQLDRYRLTVDPAALLDGLGALGGAPGAQLPETLGYELLLDEQQRLRRAEIDLGATGGRLVLTADDYGDEVSIEAPDPSQVTDAPALPGPLQAPGDGIRAG